MTEENLLQLTTAIHDLCSPISAIRSLTGMIRPQITSLEHQLLINSLGRIEQILSELAREILTPPKQVN
ncbi:MAG: hypothetical protein HN353_04935 [Bdellovibrionales bacterium]|nr:hypothetical protein [Bdellovibrionales bacterium]MBT3527368.1 hypothetical protein [Bdellovibrionales bacterium]MBT7669288.1 hypothetical protein [Bdellovibrionales bacterium]MBT7767743.1 hypothetical protein [Bdellovibrionales bacterium]